MHNPMQKKMVLGCPWAYTHDLGLYKHLQAMAGTPRPISHAGAQRLQREQTARASRRWPTAGGEGEARIGTQKDIPRAWEGALK